MLNQRLSAAQAVAAELFPTEQHVDDAIVRASKLAIALIEGRRQAKLPITAGQDGLNHIIVAAGKLVEAREQMGAAHSALRVTQDDIGLRNISFGDLWDCPPNPNKKAELPDNVANIA